MIYIYLILLTFLASLFFTKVIIDILHHKDIKDHPNHRSFHTTSTPIGGGWAIILTSIPLIIDFSIYQNTLLNVLPIIIGAIILIVISWQNDIKHINPFLRLLFHIIAIIAAMQFLPKESLFFAGALPVWLERIGIFLAWLWFTNLYNFMDGIDGITGSKTICICFGILILSLFLFIPSNILFISSILLGSSLGFLIFNWEPAKIFIGDVGSIFLGYIVAYILLLLAIEGYVTIALILPLYHLMDATIVIIKRAIKKEKIWEADQQQYFHKSVNEMGRSHAKTTSIVILCNICMIIMAIISTFTEIGSLFLIPAAIITYTFMHYLANKKSIAN